MTTTMNMGTMNMVTTTTTTLTMMIMTITAMIRNPRSSIWFLGFPEVAADTNLSEAGLVAAAPRFGFVDGESSHAASADLSSDDRSQIESLCKLIDASGSKNT